MDHFNATVFNGSMVATRRGFQVSKQRHQGTAFVNSSVQENKQQTSTMKPAYSLPIRNTQLTFITNGEDEKKLAPPRRRTRRSKSPTEKPSSAGVIKAKRLNRISNSRRQSSCSSSSTSSEDRQTRETHDRFSSEPSTSHSPRLLPPWTCYSLYPDVPDETRRFLFTCLAFAPGEGYSDDLWSLESGADSPGKDLSNVRDSTSLHCAITLGALFDEIRFGGYDSPELESLTSQLSFIVNRRLNGKSEDESDRNITIHAVATLAIVAGYLGKHDHWFVHMSGLLRLIDMAGGQNALDVRTINTIRKADFIGAISAATEPCVRFMRRQPPLRCSLPVTNAAEAALRPTLIWICLAADLLATLKHMPSSAGRMDGFGRAAAPTCRELLRYVLGPQVLTNPDLVSDADLEVCRLLDLGCLTGQKWDDRQAIKNMLGVYTSHAWL
ncbi:hypothetical protein F4810DRAFT_721990 [Camillea tinctor]|nr:hypothetical protein F4810DRAFT_721990 [Camillea tinctor]